jgi:hypothetical protein
MQITSDILNKPSIKKHYGQKAVSGYPEALIEFEKTVFTKNIETLKKLWPYLSFDLTLNNIDWLEILPIPITQNHNDWLIQNIKPQSFLNMINQHYTKVGCISINTFIEIIIWGKKVKNCVASYEERIGESIWIFFIEKDGVPLYTVETDINHYHIKQIVSQCNGSVDTSGRDFAQALILEAVGKK